MVSWNESKAAVTHQLFLHMSQVIKRYIMHAKKTAFIVEHDFIMATYLADRVVVYEGTPSIECTATTPQPLLSGMNKFLKQLEVSFRYDYILTR